MTKDFIVASSIVFDKKRWRGVIEKATEVELEIESSYARSSGEEAEIAVEMVLKELFGVDIDLSEELYDG